MVVLQVLRPWARCLSLHTLPGKRRSFAIAGFILDLHLNAVETTFTSKPSHDLAVLGYDGFGSREVHFTPIITDLGHALQRARHICDLED